MMFRFSFPSSLLIIHSDGVKGNSMKINIYWSEMRSDYNKTPACATKVQNLYIYLYTFMCLGMYIYTSVTFACLLHHS